MTHIKGQTEQEYQDTIARIKRLLEDPVYAAQPDDDARNPWVTNQKALSRNISRFDAMGLQLLSLIDNHAIDDPMPKEIKLLAQRFLENSVGNVKLNSFLSQEAIKHMDFKNSDILPHIIPSICNFSFKTRNFGQGESVLKLIKLYNSLISGSSVPDQDKLSLKELSVAFGLTKISMFKNQNIIDLISGSTKLEHIYKSSIKAQKILDHMEQESSRDVQKLGAGVLILEDSRKTIDLTNATIGFRSRMRMHLVTRYHHAAMLNLTGQNQVRLSEITTMRGFNPKEFDIAHQLYSDMYKIDPIALIPKEHHKLLEQVYGTDWQLEVASKFKVIENEIYTKGHTRFRGLVAGVAELENASGVASIIPFGHKKLEPTDFEELHKDVMVREKYNNDSGMLCSSFCAISIATSLVELDKQIKKDIKSSTLVTDLKKIDTLNMVKIPFDKHEDLYKIHPERLLGILKSCNCVQPIQLKVAEHYVKESHRVAQAAKKHVAPTTPKKKAVDRYVRHAPVIQSRL